MLQIVTISVKLVNLLFTVELSLNEENLMIIYVREKINIFQEVIEILFNYFKSINFLPNLESTKINCDLSLNNLYVNWFIRA